MARERFHDRPPRFGPMQLWRASIALEQRRLYRAAKTIKAINFLVFRAILPPQAVVGEGVRLDHYGAGVVIHPNTTLGPGCRVYHQVTIGSSAAIGSDDRIEIGRDVLLGAGAKIINRIGATLVVGDHAQIGANAVVTSSVPAHARVYSRSTTEVVAPDPAEAVGDVAADRS